MDAVRCAKLARKPSPRVHLARYWLKVIWIDALSHSAKVVKLQPFGDYATMVFVAPAVSVNLFALIFKCAIPAWVQRTSPLPAASGFINCDVLPKTDLPRGGGPSALPWFLLCFFHRRIIPQNRGFTRTNYCYTFSMPLYDYFCEKCESVVEIMHPMEEDIQRLHENCDGHLVRLFSAPEVIYQGKGWAKKDRS